MGTVPWFLQCMFGGLRKRSLRWASGQPDFLALPGALSPVSEDCEGAHHGKGSGGRRKVMKHVMGVYYGILYTLFLLRMGRGGYDTTILSSI